MSDENIPNNFLGIPTEFSDKNNSKVFVLPVPFAGTVSYGKGTDKGPEAVIKASMNQVEWYDEETGIEALRIGIHTLPAMRAEETAEEMYKAVQKRVSEILNAGKFPVVIGGEHSISVGTACALKEKYGNISVLQIDAHSDMRDEWDFNKFSHACAMRRISEMGARCVHVGIRSQDIEEAEFLKASKENFVYYAKYINEDRHEKWIDDAVARLGDNVFITIDVDGFDPSIMPSTGTPEPGGLEWYTVLRLLRRVCEKKNVIGFDVVELAPIKGMHAPDFLCARLIYKLIGYKFLKELK